MATSPLTQVNSPLLIYGQANLWAAPYDNQQFRLELGRLTTRAGVQNSFLYMKRYRSLPTSSELYHVYTMSGTTAGYWNMLGNGIKKNPVDTWYRVSSLCTNRGMHIDLYVDSGRLYPRDEAWVMRTYDGLHLLAVKKLVNYPLVWETPFYLRCYTPDWTMYNVNNPDGNVNSQFRYQSLINATQSTLTGLKNTYAQWTALGGKTTVYWNGVKVAAIPPFTALTPDDILELFFDPTVYRVETYPVSVLPNYHSTLDQRRKLIIHPPKPVPEDWTLRSFDDCDFYLVDGNGKGVYINGNNVANIRQLTHRDYALAGDYLADLGATLPELTNLNKAYVQIVYRSSLWAQKLPWESQRVRYLYRLTDARILNALTGVNSTVPEWSADGLESSATMQLNRSLFKDMTDDLVEAALGYNALTKVFADSPLSMPFTEIGAGYEVPRTYNTNALAIEYDANGLLLGTNATANAVRYRPINPTCAKVEFIPGVADVKRNDTVTKQPVTLNPRWGYRVYVSDYSIDTQAAVGNWEDVTGTPAYTVTNGVLSWKIDTVNQIGRVIINDKFLKADFDLNHLDKSLYFSITEIWTGGGIVADIPPANLYIWMNNRALIENVDYLMDYPRVYVINKQYVSDTGINHFMVIAEGVSPDINTAFNQSELGFIIGGQLGFNGRYNLRDDRRTRIVADGRVWLPGEIGSSEDGAPVDYLNPLNGFPYSVRHVYQTVNDIEPYNTQPGFDKAREADGRMSGYMTANFTKLPNPTVIIQDKYRLFSPFLNQIANAIKLKVLVVPDLNGYPAYSDQQIDDLTAAHQWLLKYDPAKRNFDPHFYTVQPTSITDSMIVTPQQFLFLSQVNDLYLGGACSIEGHFEVNK